MPREGATSYWTSNAKKCAHGTHQWNSRACGICWGSQPLPLRCMLGEGGAELVYRKPRATDARCECVYWCGCCKLLRESGGPVSVQGGCFRIKRGVNCTLNHLSFHQEQRWTLSMGAYPANSVDQHIFVIHIATNGSSLMLLCVIAMHWYVSWNSWLFSVCSLSAVIWQTNIDLHNES